jgi:hypothetical protein
MEFGAKGIAKFIPSGRFGGKYVLQTFVMEVVFECLCPAKIHPANGFLETTIGKYVLQWFDWGGLIRKAPVKRFDFAIAVWKIQK